MTHNICTQNVFFGVLREGEDVKILCSRPHATLHEYASAGVSHVNGSTAISARSVERFCIQSKKETKKKNKW